MDPALAPAEYDMKQRIRWNVGGVPVVFEEPPEGMPMSDTPPKLVPYDVGSGDAPGAVYLIQSLEGVLYMAPGQPAWAEHVAWYAEGMAAGFVEDPPADQEMGDAWMEVEMAAQEAAAQEAAAQAAAAQAAAAQAAAAQAAAAQAAAAAQMAAGNEALA